MFQIPPSLLRPFWYQPSEQDALQEAFLSLPGQISREISLIFADSHLDRFAIVHLEHSPVREELRPLKSFLRESAARRKLVTGRARVVKVLWTQRPRGTPVQKAFTTSALNNRTLNDS